jgi:hypothetical protein
MSKLQRALRYLFVKQIESMRSRSFSPMQNWKQTFETLGLHSKNLLGKTEKYFLFGFQIL